MSPGQTAEDAVALRGEEAGTTAVEEAEGTPEPEEPRPLGSGPPPRLRKGTHRDGTARLADRRSAGETSKPRLGDLHPCPSGNPGTQPFTAHPLHHAARGHRPRKRT